MNGSISGLLPLIIAGILNASFTLPMKYARRWAWENTWLAWTLFALVMLPIFTAWVTIPHLYSLYRFVPGNVLYQVIALGTGWGVAQVFFGLAIDQIGIALTFALVMGTSAAIGTLIPLIHLHPERIGTSAGYGTLTGVAIVIAGVAICAVAGIQREKALSVRAATHKNSTIGLLLALLCGLGASFVNLGIAFGNPLIQTARSFGASALNSSNAVWMPLMLAGAVPNLAYCAWLLIKRRTGARFAAGGASHWSLAFVMAVFWFGSTLLYGISITNLGTWGPILGWPLFMSLIVITASLLGMLTGEWRNSGTLPIRIQWAGVSLLVLAVFTLAALTRSHITR